MKKITSLFTMVAFIIFSLSCTFTRNVSLDADAAKENGKIRVVQVVTKSGEIIEFSKGQPGRIHNGSITGVPVNVTGELDKTYIKEREKDKKGKILRITVSIPLSEVEMIVGKKIDIGMSFLASLGLCAAALGLVIGALFYVSLRGD